MYRPGKAAYPIGYREFESLPFRHLLFPLSSTYFSHARVFLLSKKAPSVYRKQTALDEVELKLDEAADVVYCNVRKAVGLCFRKTAAADLLDVFKHLAARFPDCLFSTHHRRKVNIHVIYHLLKGAFIGGHF